MVPMGDRLLTRSEAFGDVMNIQHCGKMICLSKMLKAWDVRKEKCLVFSWSTQTLDVIEAFCKAKGYKYHRFDGSVAQSKRQTIIDDFNESKTSFVFLCSTRAGGMGVNLQSAAKVVIFDVKSVDFASFSRTIITR